MIRTASFFFTFILCVYALQGQTKEELQEQKQKAFTELELAKELMEQTAPSGQPGDPGMQQHPDLTVAAAELDLAEDGKSLDVTFDDGRAYSLTAEMLRVMSPSAEVQGHSADQRVTVPKKRNVGITQLQPVGNYAVKAELDGYQSQQSELEALQNRRNTVSKEIGIRKRNKEDASDLFEAMKEIGQNIRRLIEIGSYRGVRHRRSLPARGQRTHTNARTRKGPAKPVAGKRK